MKSKGKKQNQFMQIILAPIRLLSKVGEFYITTMNDCVARVGQGGAVVCPAPHVSYTANSFSLGNSNSVNDEKIRELLLRELAERRIAGKVGLNLHRQTGERRLPPAVGNSKISRNYSVDLGKIGRIDEDKPCTFGEEHLLCPRSRSHAIR